jgi:hypothetical protein
MSFAPVASAEQRDRSNSLRPRLRPGSSRFLNRREATFPKRTEWAVPRLIRPPYRTPVGNVAAEKFAVLEALGPIGLIKAARPGGTPDYDGFAAGDRHLRSEGASTVLRRKLDSCLKGNQRGPTDPRPDLKQPFRPFASTSSASCLRRLFDPIRYSPHGGYMRIRSGQ